MGGAFMCSSCYSSQGPQFKAQSDSAMTAKALIWKHAGPGGLGTRWMVGKKSLSDRQGTWAEDTCADVTQLPTVGSRERCPREMAIPLWDKEKMQPEAYGSQPMCTE